MGKRPYYILEFCRDCDGYYSETIYIGTNWKAALDRYRAAFAYIKKIDFYDHGIHDDDINGELRMPDHQLVPGQSVCSYLNDDNECWDSLYLKCRETNKFHNTEWERYYKELYPNSKY